MSIRRSTQHGKQSRDRVNLTVIQAAVLKCGETLLEVLDRHLITKVNERIAF